MGEERFHKQCTKALTTEEKTSKMDFIKIKNACFEKGTVKRMETQDRLGENVCKDIYMIKNLCPKYSKNS